MSLEIARSLSISDLLRVLNEKLGLECTRLQKEPIPLASSAGLLESEIDSLETRAQDVLGCILSLRNHLRPVNRLPPEILSLIARCLIQCDAAVIIPLTHVCRYWRESIVSTPENWTSISTEKNNIGAITLVLERAKAAPLEIRFSSPLATDRSLFANILAPHVQNTRFLHVIGTPTMEEFRNAFPGFPQSMPNLRSLSLCGKGWLDDNSIDLFESFVPTLDYLSLVCVPLYPSLLALATLTEFTIGDSSLNLHLDTLLDFLEGNHSLETVYLCIDFADPSFLNSRRRTVMENGIRDLSIHCEGISSAQALVSNIPVQRGANLWFQIGDETATLGDFLPDISLAHLLKPPSPTSFHLQRDPYRSYILICGPGGSVFFHGPSISQVPFTSFEGLPLASVRNVHLRCRNPNTITTLETQAFHPSHFPALKKLTLDCDDGVLAILSALLLHSSPSPSLKTLGFLNCNISGGVMEELTKFASERLGIPALTPLHRIQIVSEQGIFPGADPIRKLREYVKVVEVRMGDKFSADLR